MANAPVKKATASARAKKAAPKAPAKRTTANARASKVAAKAPASKVAAKAPDRKVTASAPVKKVATHTPARNAKPQVPATPEVALEAPNVTPDVEAAVQRIKETSERVLELSRKNGLVWLAVFEKMLDGVLKLEQDAASDLGSDWFEKVVSSQADFIRDTSHAYLNALKDRLQ